MYPRQQKGMSSTRIKHVDSSSVDQRHRRRKETQNQDDPFDYLQGIVPTKDLFDDLEASPRDQHDRIARQHMNTWTDTVTIDLADISDDFDDEMNSALENKQVPRVVSSDRLFESSPLTKHESLIVKDIKNKGKGVVATRDIQAGALLYNEQGLIGSSDYLAAAILIDGLNLSRLDQDPRCLPHSWSPFLQFSLVRWNTAHLQVSANHFYVDVDQDPDRMAIYPSVSRINHSCNSNAVWTIDSKEQMCVYAKNVIREGQEICIMYSDEEGHDSKAPFQCDCGLTQTQRRRQAREDSSLARRYWSHD